MYESHDWKLWLKHRDIYPGSSLVLSQAPFDTPDMTRFRPFRAWSALRRARCSLGFGESFAFATRLAARRSSFLPITVAAIVSTIRTMIIKNKFYCDKRPDCFEQTKSTRATNITVAAIVSTIRTMIIKNKFHCDKRPDCFEQIDPCHKQKVTTQFYMYVIEISARWTQRVVHWGDRGN